MIERKWLKENDWKKMIKRKWLKENDEKWNWYSIWNGSEVNLTSPISTIFNGAQPLHWKTFFSLPPSAKVFLLIKGANFVHATYTP